MTPESFDAIARRFRFDQWSGANALGRGLFVRNYRVPAPWPGWQLVRQWVVPAFGDVPPGLQTVWRNPQAGPDATVRIDVYECASREAAHRQMLRLLGEHQVQGPEPVPHGDVGDVQAVGTGGDTTVFARGNLVVFVARAGTQRTEAHAVASSLDADITFEPPEGGQPLEAMAESVADPRATVKIFADGAEIVEEAGQIEIRVTGTAGANTRVYTLPAEGGPSRASAMEQQEKQR